jgi:hypothetical protein
VKRELRKEGKKMKSRKIFVTLAAVAILALLAAGGVLAFPPKGPNPQGGAPMLISYQGRLTDPTTGQPVADGNYSITFRIYTTQTDGSPIWSETQTVSVSGGLFNVLLGSVNPLSATVFSGTDRWLEVVVEGQTLSPRQRIASVAYSIQAEEAKNADMLDGSDSSAFAFATHGHWGASWSGSGIGLTLNSSNNDGLCIQSAGDGVRVESAGDDGVQVTSASYGFYVESATKDGVVVWSAGDDGVYVSSAGRYGVYADSTATYGFCTPDSLYVGGKIDVVGTVDPLIGERFKVDPKGQYEVGDLLVIDPNSPYLVLSSEPNDTKVIGVVGPSLDYKDGELMVIVFGWHGAKPAENDSESVRVVARIKVDASYGPIRRGDLLTSSPTPGHAMKAQPVKIGGVEIYRPGTIIGKALEGLSEGRGLIEVFIVL